MSVFGSARTNFSTSDLSFESSALMTTASMRSFSDADYESSNELLDTHKADYVEPQVFRRSPNFVQSTKYNCAMSSQSSSVLWNKSQEVVSPKANNLKLTIKSDTYISQETKVISDFMNEVLNNDVGESKLIVTPGPIVDVQSESIVDIVTCKSVSSIHKELRTLSGTMIECNVKSKSPETIEDCEAKRDLESLNETKKKILDNLAQIAYNNFFLKPGIHYVKSFNDNLSASKVSICSPRNKSESKINVFSKKEKFAGRCSRVNGVESILRIDHELQPLNIMLSRLLSEFRAMDLRGRLGYVDPKIYNFKYFADLNSQYQFKKTRSSNSSSMNSIKSYVVDDTKMLLINKDVPKENSLQFDKRTEAASVSNVRLNQHQKVISEGKSNTQTARSYENNNVRKNCKPDFHDEEFQLRAKEISDHDSHVRRCIRQKRNVEQKEPSHSENRCVSERPRFDCGLLEEIASMNRRCIQRHRESGIKKCNENIQERKQRKKYENESPKLSSEETSDFSYRSMISPVIFNGGSIISNGCFPFSSHWTYAGMRHLRGHCITNERSVCVSAD